MKNKRTKEDLRELQALPLDLKILKTKNRIKEFVDYYGGIDYCRVSTSGGKDSTVLWYIVKEIYPEAKGVFCDTGLEYPEIRQFVKTLGDIEFVRPKMRFDEVIKTYGYPVIGKEVADCVYWAKRGNQSRIERLNGTWRDKNGELSMYNVPKYKPLLDVDFNISGRCCGIMKEQSVYQLHKATITAVMAEESRMRLSAWLKTGCNAFKKNKSNPMSFWTNQDVLQFLKSRNIPIASVYGDAYVEVPVEYGKLKYCFTQPEDDFVNIEKIIESTDKNDTYTIHVQPTLLIKALKAAQKTNKYVKVQFGDKLSPFIIKAKCGETNNWQVVLPARGAEE